MKKKISLVLALCLIFLLCSGCGAQADAPVFGEGIPEIPGLTFESQMPLQYANQFAVYRYEGGYRVITVADGRSYLVVPLGAEVPKKAKGYTVLQQPISDIYLVATAAMSLICALDGVDTVTLTGAKEGTWYVEAAADAMAKGTLTYAGKYSSPDYELLLGKHCGLALESTMIYHSPEVLEKLEELGIPVLAERSSYENHPLGRTEWMKLYGVLLGKEEQAETLFSKQAAILEEMAGSAPTGKTVAYFYVTGSGTVSVRKSFDYVSTMIRLAGGEYIFSDLGDAETATSSVNMTMEDFYASAKDADYLIYNATIDAPMESLKDLLAKSELFADFKAFQSGQVWCTGKNLYQATDSLGFMISDIHAMLTDSSADTLTFIHKLN